MDEATLRFFEEIEEKITGGFEWSVPVISVWDLNDLLAKHLPLLSYHNVGDDEFCWELRIGGKREE